MRSSPNVGNIGRTGLPKCDAKSEQGLFLENNRAYRVFNNRTETVMETINVVVKDSECAMKQIGDEESETPMVTVAPTSTHLLILR